ncbi:hypothetical protein AN641_05965 [Candidatus Epulonipiscioides gigas]|nr:hypothetical protein AN641_05965 [Epulopiscium sp. SCG-C07WGA-EpuloA2]
MPLLFVVFVLLWSSDIAFRAVTNILFIDVATFVIIILDYIYLLIYDFSVLVNVFDYLVALKI